MQALELIRDAYQEIGRQASEQEITGDMGQTAIRYLNRMMAAKSYYALSYTEIANTSDEITTPEYTWEWMVKNLAIKLAPQFGTLESYGALVEDADEAWSTVLIYLSRISPPQLNGNVPYGSGNKRPGNWSRKFYPETDNGVLTEGNAEIVVEDGT